MCCRLTRRCPEAVIPAGRRNPVVWMAGRPATSDPMSRGGQAQPGQDPTQPLSLRQGAWVPGQTGLRLACRAICRSDSLSAANRRSPGACLARLLLRPWQRCCPATRLTRSPSSGILIRRPRAALGPIPWRLGHIPQIRLTSLKESADRSHGCRLAGRLDLLWQFGNMCGGGGSERAAIGGGGVWGPGGLGAGGGGRRLHPGGGPGHGPSRCPACLRLLHPGPHPDCAPTRPHQRYRQPAHGSSRRERLWGRRGLQPAGHPRPGG